MLRISLLGLVLLFLSPFNIGWALSSWTSAWYSRAHWEKQATPDFYEIVRERRNGGDIQGVINQLDYLQDLGIGGIYFNPVFDAQSMHKYDATYYHHIDRNFGHFNIY